MTLPIIFGLGMTISFWLVYRLKSRRLRKWSGVGMAILGWGALFKLSDKSHEWFMALGIMGYCGLWLFEERDRFSEDES
jgi:hypothetical protein